MATMNDDAIRTAARVCFFAHYHPRAIVADYVLRYLKALRDAGFAVVVLSTAELPHAEQAKLANACARLIMRENVGLDFGGWIEAFRRFMPLKAELLLLANDSVYGPVGDLGDFIDRLTATPADFYGAVESWEGGAHLQSWFLLLRPAAYGSEAFRAIMARPIPSDMLKLEIIDRYERRLTHALGGAGLRHYAAYTPHHDSPVAGALCFNPMQYLWKTLVTRYGVPFIKIELLRDNPHNVASVHGWRRLVRRRAPALVRLIETDLILRNARAMPTVRQRFADSAANHHPLLRPELQPLIVAEAVLSGVQARRVIGWLYRATVRIGTSVRRRLAPMR